MVLDLVLGDIDALTAIGLLHERDPELPVVVFASVDPPYLRAEAEAHGAAAFFRRGADPQAVLDGFANVAATHEGRVRTMTIKVFLLDDHEIVRRGVRELLEAEEDFEVVGEAATAEEARYRIPATSPDVAVLDVRLPDGSGVEVCRDVRSDRPDLACIMLTSFADDEALFEAIMAGASGYVLKQVSGSNLVDAFAASDPANHCSIRGSRPACSNVCGRGRTKTSASKASPLRSANPQPPCRRTDEPPDRRGDVPRGEDSQELRVEPSRETGHEPAHRGRCVRGPSGRTSPARDIGPDLLRARRHSSRGRSR